LKGDHPRIISAKFGWELCPAFQNTDQDGRHSRT
jgi:hypothetical protein